jgi:hypothetical protein
MHLNDSAIKDRISSIALAPLFLIGLLAPLIFAFEAFPEYIGGNG